MTIETEYGYKIPEVEDKDWWDSFNYNFNRLNEHSHDSVDSPPVLLANQTEDEDHRLVTDLQIAQWNANEGGAGGTAVNYVVNPNAELSSTVGVAETDITLSGETSNPIQGAQSFKLTSLAVPGQADWSIEISDNFVIDGGLAAQATAQARTAASVALGDYTIGVYNVTGAAYVTPVIDVLSDAMTFFDQTFIPLAGQTYVFRAVFIQTADAGKIADFDNFFISTDVQVTVAEKEAWDQNIVDTGTNTTNIGNNTTNIGINAGNISTNAGNISTNADDIAAINTDKSKDLIKNYVLNPNAEEGLDDVVASTITLALETGSPLEGLQSFLVTSLASTGIVDWAITLSDAYLVEGGILTGISAQFRTDALMVLGDYIAGIYNVTDAEYAVPAQELAVDILNLYTEGFTPKAGKTYVLRLEFTDTTAAKTVVVDSLSVGVGRTTVVGESPKTVWVDSTVQPLTVNRTTTFDNLNIRAYESDGKYYLEGQFWTRSTDIMVNGAEAKFVLTGIVFASLPDNQRRAITAWGDGGGTELAASLEEDDFTFILRNTGVDTPAASRLSASFTAFELAAKPSWFDAQLDQTTAYLMNDNLVQAKARISVANTAGTVIASGNRVPFATIIADNTNSWSTNLFAAPANGDYRVAGILTTSTGINCTWHLRVNGVVVYEFGSGASSDDHPFSFLCVNVLGGQNIDIINSTGGDRTLGPNLGTNVMTISREQDYSAGLPTSFGEAKADRQGLVKLPARTTWIVLDNTILTGNAGFINNGSYIRVSRDSNDLYSAELRIRGSKTNDNNNVNLTFVGILFAIDQGISFYNDTGASITDTTTSVFFSAGAPTTALCSGGGTLILGGKPTFFDANLDQGS